MRGAATCICITLLMLVLRRLHEELHLLLGYLVRTALRLKLRRCGLHLILLHNSLRQQLPVANLLGDGRLVIVDRA